MVVFAFICQRLIATTSYMVKRQMSLSLVGLVILVPSSSSLALLATETRRCTGNHAGAHTPAHARVVSDNLDVSRRAFLAASTFVVSGTTFAGPSNAATSFSFSAPATFGYVKRRGKWRRLGGGSVSSDSCSSNTSTSSGGTSDSVSTSKGD